MIIPCRITVYILWFSLFFVPLFHNTLPSVLFLTSFLSDVNAKIDSERRKYKRYEKYTENEWSRIKWNESQQNKNKEIEKSWESKMECMKIVIWKNGAILRYTYALTAGIGFRRTAILIRIQKEEHLTQLLAKCFK